MRDTTRVCSRNIAFQIYIYKNIDIYKYVYICKNIYISICIYDHTIAGTRLQCAVWTKHNEYTYIHTFIYVCMYTYVRIYM